jgi:AraC-like DNA-binding protein
MHGSPAHPWSLDELASRAGMSRSSFANLFQDKVGLTPGSYLVGWRITLAQDLLRKGKPLKLVAEEVGYAGPPALSRAVRAMTNQSPREWLAQQTM